MVLCQVLELAAYIVSSTITLQSEQLTMAISLTYLRAVWIKLDFSK